MPLQFASAALVYSPVNYASSKTRWTRLILQQVPFAFWLSIVTLCLCILRDLVIPPQHPVSRCNFRVSTRSLGLPFTKLRRLLRSARSTIINLGREITHFLANRIKVTEPAASSASPGGTDGLIAPSDSSAGGHTYTPRRCALRLSFAFSVFLFGGLFLLE